MVNNSSGSIFFNLFDEVIVVPKNFEKTREAITREVTSKQTSIERKEEEKKTLNQQESFTSIDMTMNNCSVERRWLGSFSIPFSTLLFNNNNRIEGTFAIQTPVTLLGYEYEETSPLLQSVSGTGNSRMRQGSSIVTGSQGANNTTSTLATRQRHRSSGDTILSTASLSEDTLLTLFVTLDPPVASSQGVDSSSSPQLKVRDIVTG